MKKGKTWFKRLTTAQKIKFRENIRLQSNYAGDWYEFMKDKHPTFYDFVMVSFIFRQTIEGSDYWLKVANQKVK